MIPRDSDPLTLHALRRDDWEREMTRALLAGEALEARPPARFRPLPQPWRRIGALFTASRPAKPPTFSPRLVADTVRSECDCSESRAS
jgi:hypothetical protein